MTTAKARQAPTRRRPVGARLPRAAQRQRAVQEGRQPAQRARPHREHLRPSGGFDSIDKGDLRGRFRWWGLYTQRKPGYDGTWTGDENTDMLEDEYFMLRVRCDGGALTRPRCARSADLDRVRAATPPTSPTARTSSTTGSSIENMPEIWRPPRRGRPADHRGVRRLPARRARLAAGRRIARRGDRRHLGDRRDRPPLHRQAGVLQPAAQVQDRDLGPAGRRPRGQRRRVHRRRTIPSTAPASTCGSAAACPPTRCWRQRVGAWVPLDEVPDVWEGVRQRLPRLRLPPAARQGAAEVPDQGLGRREIPRGARERVPRPRSSTDPRPSRCRTPSTTSACSGSRTGSTPSVSPRSRAACRAPS